MKINYKYLLIFLLSADLANAGVLSPAELYSRCYADFTGEVVKRNDTLLAQVKAGTLSYVNACMNLLARANLGSDGVVVTKVGMTATVDPVAQRILQTFNAFHGSWFGLKTFDNCQQNELHDPQAMAYQVSNVLFKNTAYSNLITEKQSYGGIRKSNVPSERFTRNTRFRTCANYENVTKFRFVGAIQLPNGGTRGGNWFPSVPEIGTLIGIKPITNDGPIPYIMAGDYMYNRPDPYENYNRQASSFPSYSATFDGFNIAEVRSPTSIRAHDAHGSGIIGNSVYFLLNNGRKELGFHSDGVVNLPRRWSKSVLRDMLCRELPVLRSEDVAPLVNVASTIPFRAATSCMTCHHTMDPMAYGIRNLSWARASRPGDTGFRDENNIPFSVDGSTTVYNIFQEALVTRKFPQLQTNTGAFLRTSPDSNFHLKPPQGYFNFRDYQGVLHSHSFLDLNGTEGLGNYLRNLDDYYICAAKRYYQYFTGINVPIYDFTDPVLNKNAGADEIKHRNKVIQMGRSLRTHQNLQTLIRDIISTEEYQNQGYGIL